MYIASTLNANNKSKGLVRAVVCSYGGKFKFVAKSEEYGETVNAIRKAFDLHPETPVTLSTSSLDVCRGQAVEIDEITYPMLWEFVDEVAITTPEETASTAPNVLSTTHSQSRRKSRISAIAATARRSLAFTSRLSDVEGLPLRSLNSSTASIPPPPNDAQDEQAQADLVEAELLDAATEEQEEEQYEHVEELVVKPSQSKTVGNLFDDDDVEEAPRPSRQQPRKPSLPPTPSPTSRRAVPTTLSLGEPSVKAEVPVKTEKPEPKKSKFKAKAEPEPKAKAKVEAGPKTQRTREASPAPRAKASRSAGAKDSQIAIAISGPEDDQRAQFKMRGKHQIQKILKTACATFGLDFERATLHLVDEDEVDDNGDPVTTELPKDKTVLRCGIKDGAHLVIHIEQEEEEEGEEEEAYDY